MMLSYRFPVKHYRKSVGEANMCFTKSFSNASSENRVLPKCVS